MTDAVPVPARRRELRLALVLGAAGAGLVLSAASTRWVTYAQPSHVALGAPRVSSTGTQLYPAIGAMGWVGLAGALVLVALRGWARRAVGLLLAAAGAVVVVDGVRALLETPVPVGARCGAGAGCSVLRQYLHASEGWVVLTLVGGVVLALAGLLTLLRGGSWAGLGSSYDAPGAAPEPPVTDKAVWDALDRGDDPTA